CKPHESRENEGKRNSEDRVAELLTHHDSSASGWNELEASHGVLRPAAHYRGPAPDRYRKSIQDSHHESRAPGDWFARRQSRKRVKGLAVSVGFSIGAKLELEIRF